MELLPTEAAGKFDESSGVILNIDQVQDLRVKDASRERSNIMGDESSLVNLEEEIGEVVQNTDGDAEEA